MSLLHILKILFLPIKITPFKSIASMIDVSLLFIYCYVQTWTELTFQCIIVLVTATNICLNIFVSFRPTSFHTNSAFYLSRFMEQEEGLPNMQTHSSSLINFNCKSLLVLSV